MNRPTEKLVSAIDIKTQQVFSAVLVIVSMRSFCSSKNDKNIFKLNSRMF